MLSLADFRVRYPEFGETSDAFVQSWLDAAWLEIDTSVWLALVNTGHGLLTAHYLADSPLGNTAKLNPKRKNEPSTVYERRYRKLVRLVAAGIRST